jgi:hypothetical protein
MNEKQKEALLILQEECAEVIQAASKVFRFGVDQCVISDGNINGARQNKKEKLKTWSGIYK